MDAWHCRRKNDSVGNQNLLTLLTDRLLLNASYLSLATYNVLFEILIEQMSPLISYTVHAPISDAMRFENPTMLKVIANLITQSENRPELIKVHSYHRFVCLSDQRQIIEVGLEYIYADF